MSCESLFGFYNIKIIILDKTEFPMNLKNRTLSTEIEYYPEIPSIKKRKKFLRHFKTLSLISKLIPLILGFLFLYVGLLGSVVVAYQFCVRL